MRYRNLVCVVTLQLLAAGPVRPAELLNDDFSGLAPGMFSAGVIGAQGEYHHITALDPRGNWSVATFRSDESQRAWRVIVEDGRHVMAQVYTATPPERAYTHPTIKAGDDLWADYVVEARFAPAAGDGLSGVMFRYQTNRQYYFAGISGQTAILEKVNDGTGFRTMDETILAQKPCAWKPGEYIALKVSAAGDQLTAEIGGVTLTAKDATFAHGKIGLLSDMPTRFGAVRVSCSDEARQAFETARAARQAEEDGLVAANPKPVLWKKIRTPGFGVGRDIRFGDLDGDGRLDILIAQQTRHGPADGFSEVGCLTAMTLDGKILWQNGTPDSWNTVLTNDVAVQIHDLYGDGHNEVVYCRDFELVVADGATGKTIAKVPMPQAPLDPIKRTRRFERVLGDAIYFCDLEGKGRPSDIIVKDRYRNIWAYDEHLKPLWHLTLNTGHYPFAFDVDGDGKDELMVGYSLLNHDGKVLWSHEGEIQDHADGVAILRFKDGTEPRLICNASDEGLFFADLKGRILRRYQLGHAQNVSVADYRPDLPGLESLCITFWGNQGIVHMFNADGETYKVFEPSNQGSMLCPVNWTGRPGEYWMLSAEPVSGGLFDGWGRRVVRFPADGHPDLCCAALDLTGDCRDEIVVWDPYEIWIYTQSDSPKSGRLYQPRRNALYNESDYQTGVSLPGWSDDKVRAPIDR